MKIYPHSLLNGRCRSCSQPILWARTFPNQKKVPLDLPLKHNGLEFDADGDEIATLQSLTHFDTCPNYKRAAGHVKPILQGKLF